MPAASPNGCAASGRQAASKAYNSCVFEIKKRGRLTEMSRHVAGVLYVVAMAAVITGVDFAFFRNRFWERLTVNIGIVMVFAAFYLRFLKRP
jgi:hypothetical protein